MRSSSVRWMSNVPQMKRTEAVPAPYLSSPRLPASTTSRLIREPEVVVAGEHDDVARLFHVDFGRHRRRQVAKLLVRARLLERVELGLQLRFERLVHDLARFSFEVENDLGGFAGAHQFEGAVELRVRHHVRDDRARIDAAALDERLGLIPRFEHAPAVDTQDGQALEDDALGEVDVDVVGRDSEQRGAFRRCAPSAGRDRSRRRCPTSRAARRRRRRCVRALISSTRPGLRRQKVASAPKRSASSSLPG